MHFWDGLLHRYIGKARADLGDEVATLWEEGRRMSLERAVEEAPA